MQDIQYLAKFFPSAGFVLCRPEGTERVQALFL